jgi:hypothetical protein
MPTWDDMELEHTLGRILSGLVVLSTARQLVPVEELDGELSRYQASPSP